MRFTIIAAAIGLAFGGAAFAADKSAEQKAAKPSASEAGVEKPKAAAKAPEGDDSVRKQHVERDKSATADQGAAGPAGAAPKVRDWKQVDSNNDNLIQPEEMSAWLEKTGPQATAADKGSKDKGAAGPAGAEGSADKGKPPAQGEGKPAPK